MTSLKALLFAVSLLFAATAQAQLATNGAYLEVGGSAAAVSVNYERQVRPQWFGRAGLGVVSSSSSTSGNDTTWVVPLTVSHVSNPAGAHHLELGGGITISGGDRQDLYSFSNQQGSFSAVAATGIVGYRYQKPGRGFQFRAVATPFYFGGGDFEPWAGVSFGYAW